jgi:phosphonoacetaldehyde hydrolase
MIATRTPQKIQAVMLDWAGTTVDHGSLAPVIALQALFAQRGITLSVAHARRDMGLLKRDHIRAILSLTPIQSQWIELTGHSPSEDDVDSLFRQFGPIQMECITQNSSLIERVAETVHKWQQRGLRIGTTTGYLRSMLDPVMQLAAEAGYVPDASVCPDEVSGGRPSPWMLFRNMELLSVYPPNACVKIGDTISDVEEGLNAGMWTIGLTRSGNMVGLTAADWELLPASAKLNRLAKAGNDLLAAGAHFVAEDLTACDPLIDQIESLQRGE